MDTPSPPPTHTHDITASTRTHTQYNRNICWLAAAANTMNGNRRHTKSSWNSIWDTAIRAAMRLLHSLPFLFLFLLIFKCFFAHTQLSPAIPSRLSAPCSALSIHCAHVHYILWPNICFIRILWFEIVSFNFRSRRRSQTPKEYFFYCVDVVNEIKKKGKN